MSLFLPTIIFRHRKENLKKCTLRNLENRKDFCFLTYPIDPLPPLDHYVILALNAPLLSHRDCSKGIFLIDATWRYADQIKRVTPPLSNIAHRSLPPARTSYPRKQTDCIDPNRGLASIEALYLAYLILGKNPKGLLDGYYWKDTFLKKNDFLLKNFAQK